MSALRAVKDAWMSTVGWLWAHSVGWLLSVVLIGLIRAYQLGISPLLPPSCRYHPSCSAYAVGAIQVHGSLKGTALASWRLLRCNPFSGGGVDPVPSRGRWLPDILPDGRPRRAGTATPADEASQGPKDLSTT